MPVTHITVGYPYTDQLNLLKEQSNKFGFRFINIGSNCKRNEITFYTKIKLMHDFLNKSAINDGEIILFTDGYDVSIQGDANNFLRKFNSFHCDILFNAEKPFWPEIGHLPQIGEIDREAIKDFFDKKEHKYNNYLNSGVYIGYAKCIRDMMEFCVLKHQETGISDDQALIQLYFFSEKTAVLKLDYEEEIFSTLSLSESDYILDGLFVKNVKTEKFPILFHSNGNKNYMNALNKIYDLQNNSNLMLEIFFITDGDNFISFCDQEKKLKFTEKNDSPTIFVRTSNFLICAIDKNGKFLTFFQDGTCTNESEHLFGWESMTIAEGELITYHNKNICDYFLTEEKYYTIKNLDFHDVNSIDESVFKIIRNIGWS